MATTKTQDKKKSGQGEKRASMLPKEHKGVGLPVPAPRLHGHYVKVVRAKLMQQFGLKNPHEVPNLSKITLNVGMGEAIKQPKILDAIVDEMATITGQKPLRTKAKKSIANFGQREGQAARADLVFEERRDRLQRGQVVVAGVFVHGGFEALAGAVDFGVEVGSGAGWLFAGDHAASIRLWNTAAPPVRPSTGSEARSGWGIMPMTLPRAFMRPAMSRAEPLGLSR